MHATLNSEEFRAFWAPGKLLRFKKKETIILNLEEVVPSYYWIKSGYVKVCSYTKSGSEQIHFIYGPSDIFPVGWLLTGSAQWVCFVAIDNVQIVAKDIKSFHEFIAKKPILFSEIKRMQLNAHDRLYGMNIDSPIERIAHCLMTLAERFGKVDGEYTIINIPLSQQEFADMVKMSRETAGKVLNELEDSGCIILGRKRILIKLPELSKVLEN